MIRTKDLQIGDWVNDNFMNINFQVFKISGGTVNHAPHSDSGFLEEEIDPIPITPEILEKNGFKDYGKGVFKLNIQGKNKCIEIFFNDDDISLSIINTRIDQLNVRVTFESSYAMINKQLYVHELQHALRLCGIDKEIVL